MIGLVQGKRVFHEHRGLPAIESGRFFRVLRQGFQDFTDPAPRFFAEKNSPLLRKVLVFFHKKGRIGAELRLAAFLIKPGTWYGFLRQALAFVPNHSSSLIRLEKACHKIWRKGR